MNMVGLDGNKLGDNVDRRKIANELPGASTLPYGDFVGKVYRSESDVKRALIGALAKKVSTIRSVREFSERRIYTELHMNTKPTKKGERLINYSHEFYVVQSLVNKPLSYFVDKPSDSEVRDVEAGNKWDQKLQYLVLCRAENEKMITVTYTGNHRNLILERLCNVCLDTSRGADSEVNSIRREILAEATDRYCIPEAINAMRDDALRASREHLVELCGDALWTKASEDLTWMRSRVNATTEREMKEMQTNQMKLNRLEKMNNSSSMYDDSEDEYDNMGRNDDYEIEGDGSGVQIGARYRRDGCIFIPPVKQMGKPVFVILNEAGELIDHMILSNLRRFDESQEAISSFIRLHTPRRIVINTSGGNDCVKLKRRLEQTINVINDLLSPPHFNSSAPQTKVIHLSLMDDVVSSLFIQSVRGKKMYQKYGDEKRESLKLAVSLCRYLQSPLTSICGLWCDRESSTPGGSLMSLPLHPMQSYASQESLIKSYERVLVRATAAVGVDMNRCVQYDHMSTTLPFVSGLGVRKARALMSTVRRAIAGLEANQQYFYQREDLRDPGFKDLVEPLLGERVFKNAAAFLLMPPIKGESFKLFDPLAITRIHPESYPLVDKLLKDVTAEGQSAASASSPSNDKKKQKWERIRSMMKQCSESSENPLSTILVDDYARTIADAAKQRDERLRLEMGGNAVSGNEESSSSSSSSSVTGVDGVDMGESVYMKMYNSRKYNKTNTLTHIIEELQNPCNEEKQRLTVVHDFDSPTRNQSMTPSGGIIYHNRGYKKLFQLITGLKPNFYEINPIMACTVRYKRKNDADQTHLLLDLDCGQSAKMDEMDLDPGAMEDIVQGEVFYALCHKVDHMRMIIRMTGKKAALDAWNTKIKVPKPSDEFWRPLPSKTTGTGSSAASISSSGVTTASRGPRPVNKRTIFEECFHNVSREDAIQLLKQEDVGGVVFRPSSKGNDRVNATLKFYENIYSDYVIVEEDKDETSEDTKKNLGSKLYVGERLSASMAKGTEFTSLEEIQFRHFNVMMENAESIFNHRKFLKGGRSVCESKCHDEIASNPQRCAYHFCVSHAHPGFFELGYITTKTFRYIYVQPDVDGIRCAGKLYSGDHCLTSFMTEFKKSPHTIYKKAQIAKQQYQQRVAEEKRRVDAVAHQKAELARQQDNMRWQQHQQHIGGYQGGYYQQQQYDGYSNLPQPRYNYNGQAAPTGGYYAGNNVPQGPPPPATAYSYGGGGPPPQEQYFQPPPGQGGY
jgi:hypothetical protein